MRQYEVLVGAFIGAWDSKAKFFLYWELEVEIQARELIGVFIHWYPPWLDRDKFCCLQICHGLIHWWSPIYLFVGLAFVGKNIVFRSIIEYSRLRDFGPTKVIIIIIIGLFLYEDFWKNLIFWLHVLKQTWD